MTLHCFIYVIINKYFVASFVQRDKFTNCFVSWLAPEKSNTLLHVTLEGFLQSCPGMLRVPNLDVMVGCAARPARRLTKVAGRTWLPSAVRPLLLAFVLISCPSLLPFFLISCPLLLPSEELLFICFPTS